MVLQEDGQIIKEAAKLAHLPVTIVQGRYDLVCPMKTGTYRSICFAGGR
jgi:proline iminopeptidase